MPGAGFCDHFASSAEATARLDKEAVEEGGGDGASESAKTAVNAENQVTLCEDDGRLDMDDVDDVGEGGLQVVAVLGFIGVEAFGEREECEDLFGVVVGSRRRRKRGSAVENDAGSAQLE